MKLACITQAPKISNEELLMLENELLRDELKLREIENSLEIYECILDCIEKTGKVDKSLEVMFGENVSSTETFESEIKAQYESACEGFMDLLKDSWGLSKEFVTKIFSQVKTMISKFKNVKESAFPVTVKMPVFASPERYNKSVLPVLRKIGKAHDADNSSLTDEEKSEFHNVLTATEDIEVHNSHELFTLFDKAYDVVMQLRMSNDIHSTSANSGLYDKEKSKPARDFLAMQRLIERAVKRFYASTKALYEKLPYTV